MSKVGLPDIDPVIHKTNNNHKDDDEFESASQAIDEDANEEVSKVDEPSTSLPSSPVSTPKPLEGNTDPKTSSGISAPAAIKPQVGLTGKGKIIRTGTKEIVQKQTPPVGIDRMWCPKAKCSVTAICQTCQRRFLIILTIGRSASTTLTWTLNLLPGVRMSGEDQGLLMNLMNFEREKLKYPFEMKSSNRFGAFDHNPIPEGSLACAYQKMVEAIDPPCYKDCTGTSKRVSPEDEAKEIVGFKTIKFLDSKVPAKEAAAFLLSHFPCARFIVNYSSDAEKQAQSQIRAFHGKNDVDARAKVIERSADYLIRTAKEIGDQAIVVDSAAWTKNITVLNDAVKWLGFVDCDFPKPLELNTAASEGTGSSYGHNLRYIPMNPKCRYQPSSS